MLILHSSNEVEVLADRLVAVLRAEEPRQAWGLLDPVDVVVPSAALRRWLSQAIAGRLGVAANLRATYVEELFLSALGEEARLLSPEALSLLVFNALEPTRVADCEALAPAGAYLDLDRQPPIGPEELERRRFQLSRRLARRLLDLDAERPGVTAAWSLGRPAPVDLVPGDSVHAGCEPWLGELWRQVCGPRGSLRSVNARPLLPSELLTRLEQAESKAPRTALHVFGLLPLGELQRRGLALLARKREVHVYAFSAASPEPRDKVQPLLALWEGPAAREAEAWQVACRAAGVDLEEEPEFVSREATTTLLGKVQVDVFEGADRSPRPGLDDGSLEVLAHTTPQREVERVADRIWDLVRESSGDYPLRFDEVAVVLPPRGQEEYLSHVGAVFREANGLPYRLRGLPRPGATRLLEAVELLLDLPLGRDTREDLLRILSQPNLLAGLPGADPQAWATWCQTLGLVRGLDRAAHDGTYVEGDVYSWDQALRRLGLGAFHGEEPGPETYPPAELDANEIEEAGRFVALVRSLSSDLRFAREERLPIAEWAGFFQAALAAYLRPLDDDEELLYASALGELRELGESDLQGREVGYPVARELARARLGRLTPVARPLHEGVAVTTLERARLIPYRVVFVLGLAESALPRGDVRDVLDLRLAARRPADFSAGERDRLLMLELLCSTRDYLGLSFVARDPLTGDPLQPSPLVPELLGALEQCGHLGPAGASSLWRSERLRRYDSSYLPKPLGSATTWGSALPAAWGEGRAAALRGDLRQALGEEARRLPTGRSRLAGLNPVTRRALRGPLGLALPEGARTWTAGERIRVSLSSLRKFLECPLQAWARYRLGLYDHDDQDPLATGEEPFAPARLNEANALREAFWLAVSRAQAAGVLPDNPQGPLEDAYRSVARREERAARFPTGLFREAVEERHLEQLRRWWEPLSSLDDALLRLSPVSLGLGEQAATRSLPALEFELVLPDAAGAETRVVVEISGTTRHVLPEGKGLAHVVTGGAADYHRVHAFLDQAVLAAAGAWDSEVDYGIYLCPKDGARFPKDARSFRPFAQEDASAYLRSLLVDFLGTEHDYFLPLDATLPFLFRLRSKPDEGEEELQLKLGYARRSQGAIRSDWGPVADARSKPTPRPALALAERRLGPYVERSVRPTSSRRRSS